MRVVVPVPITDNGSGVFTRSTTATYFDSSGFLRTAAIDVPRFTKEPNTGPTVLLLEPAATNLSGYSERADQWSASGVSVNTNVILAPDENNTADFVVENSSNSAHYIDTPTVTITAGAKFTLTAFMKQFNRPYVRVVVRSLNGTTSSVAQSFYVSTSFPIVVGPLATVGGATVDNVQRNTVANSAWQRFLFEGLELASDVTQVSVRFYFQDFASPSDAASNSTVVTYTGNGTSGIHIWGVDIKIGGYSSYIPTPTSSSVARGADTYGNMMVSNVAESEPVYNSGTSYSLGDRVRGNTTDTAHDLYESLNATNSDHALTDIDWWFPVGKTNRWAPFDPLRSTGATAPSPMYYAITPYAPVDVAAFSNVIADRFTIEMKDEDGVTVLTETGDLDSRAPRSRASFDLPEVENCTITLTLERDDGDVTLGSFDVGEAYDVGETLEGAEVERVNFSKIDRDEFGNSIAVRRRSILRLSATTFAETDAIDDLVLVGELLNATVGLWFTIEDPDHPYFAATFIRGIYTNYRNQLAVTSIMTSLTVEEV